MDVRIDWKSFDPAAGSTVKRSSVPRSSQSRRYNLEASMNASRALMGVAIAWEQKSYAINARDIWRGR